MASTSKTSCMAYPIILANKISLVYDFDGWSKWTAGFEFVDSHLDNSHFTIEVTDKNPLRAAMEVFLQMKKLDEAV